MEVIGYYYLVKGPDGFQKESYTREYHKKGIIMKTLYLHIGTAKTATSSIQAFLAANRKTLARLGYCFPKLPHQYPYVNPNRNAHFMLGNTYEKDFHVQPPEETEDLQEGLAQVRECFKEYDRVILTDENLWRASTYLIKDLFPYLEQEAKKQGYLIKIIVYLRRQDQYLISLWNQNVKRSNNPYTVPLDSYIKRMQKNFNLILNYDSKLDSLAELFGKDNLTVRRFEPQSWKNHSILDDFMDCIGLEVTPDFKIPDRMKNPRLTNNCAEIKRILNKNHSLSIEEMNYLASFLKSMSEMPEDGKTADNSYSMLSAKQTKELLAKYEQGNERVASEYIKDGKPMFSSEITDLPKWKANNPYMLEDMIQFFTLAFTDLHQSMKGMKKEINRLKKTSAKGQKGGEPFLSKLAHPVSSLFNTKSSD